MAAFFGGLFLLSAAGLMYQVVLTRLLSVTAWYYLAFVAISMSMFGLTAGALLVHLRPALFPPEAVPRRTAQAAWGMAVSTPLTLLTMLAIPLELSYALQTVYCFLLFSAVVSVPLVFCGVAICLALTRYGTPFGRTYAVDLAGAAAGCFGALGVLNLLDAPSALLAVSALVFAAAALLGQAAGQPRRRPIVAAVTLLVLAAVNSATVHGIQPIWSKGRIDRRDDILAEVWNPISRVRAHHPVTGSPAFWGASPVTPSVQVERIGLDIDNDAGTWITRYGGDPRELDYLRFDVVSVPAEMRQGGRAAIIGVGGGRDVLTAASFGFTRIVGIEVNPAIVGLVSRRFGGFSGFSSIPALELHVDEGRSFLTRSDERFDLVQATLVDTWAGTAAGAMALTENSLYTVEAWRLFYSRLRPGGLIAFSRWNWKGEGYQARRLFALAFAMLRAEGVDRPDEHLAYLSSSGVVTLMVSNAPLSPADRQRLAHISEERQFEVLYLPGAPISDPVLARIAACPDLGCLRALQASGAADYSPTFDDSPFFFNALRISHVLSALRRSDDSALVGTDTLKGGNLRALGFLLLFLLAAAALVGLTILWPLRLQIRQTGRRPPAGAVLYFAAVGLAFMLVEMGMMQQLGLFLGHPIYALVVVLAGLILFTGAGSLLSERMAFRSPWSRRVPALLAAGAVAGYLAAVPLLTHGFASGGLPVRVAVSLLLVAPPALFMGLCFPAGVRAMQAGGRAGMLPWMWALNGAASVLGTFAGLVAAMEFGLIACVSSGAATYLIAAASLGDLASSDAAG